MAVDAVLVFDLAEEARDCSRKSFSSTSGSVTASSLVPVCKSSTCKGPRARVVMEDERNVNASVVPVLNRMAVAAAVVIKVAIAWFLLRLMLLTDVDGGDCLDVSIDIIVCLQKMKCVFREYMKLQVQKLLLA